MLELYVIEIEGGFELNIFLIVDYGYDIYFIMVEIWVELVEIKLEVVKCFVDGLVIGWVNFFYGDNFKVLELIKVDNLGMFDGQLEFLIKKFKDFGIVDSGDVLIMGIGVMLVECNKLFFEKMVVVGVVNGDVDYMKFYMLDFVNIGVGLDCKKEFFGN